MTDDKALEALANAVLDGDAIDWAAAESGAGTAKPLVRGLQLVASVARLHRDVLPGTVTGTIDRWGHLRLLERVGRGACGEVFRAWDTRLDREVALKLLPAAPVSGAGETAGGVSSLTVGDAQSIIREGQLLAKVRHPNVVTVHGAARIDDCVGLWMEFIHGHTLETLLQQGPAFEPDEVMHIGVEVCRAVSAVHAAGLLHRDIKAHNVMRADDGRVVLMDFGTGRELSDGAQGELAGTPLYFAPELLRQEPATVQSDVYSLGVLLYRLVSGAYPVRGDSIAALRSAHQRGDRVSLRAASPATGVRLARIIERAIDPKPERRFETAAALGAALLGLQRHERRKPLLYGAAAALVLLAGGAAWMMNPGSDGAIDSVAVLPFVTAGPGHDADYLTGLAVDIRTISDGVTEAFINGLTRLPGLRVTARSVVFRYKGKQDVDPRQIGRALNVRAIVTGWVALRNDRLVIGAELMRVSDGAQLWGNQYSRPPSDLISVQEAIAGEILAKVRPQVTGEEKLLATKRYTDDAAAYQMYLRGRYTLNTGTIAGYKNAIEHFQQAIHKDAKYALAYAGLADAYLQLGSYWVETITEARAAAEQALKLDPDLAEARPSLGQIKLWLNWDWPAARREFEQGITLNPASALAHNHYAMYLATLGRLSDAIGEVRRALDLDPLSPIVNSDLGWYLLFSGQHDEAIAQFRKTLDMDANSVAAHRGLGIAYSEAGQHDAAIAELKRALLLSENSPVVQAHLGAAHARQGAKAAAADVLKDLQARSAREYVPASAPAIVLAALGDRARALDHLERAYAEHDFALVQIVVAPWFKPLRGEDRYDKLVVRLGLPR